MFNLSSLSDKREKAYREANWDQVITYALKLLKDDPEDLETLNDLAVSYFEIKQFDQSFEICKQLQSLLPSQNLVRQLSGSGTRYMRHHIVYGMLLHQRGQFEAALEVFNGLKCLKGQFSEKFHYIAQILLRQERVDPAIGEYAQMWKLRPDREPKIIKELQAILEKYPMQTKAHRLLFEIHREKGRLPSVIQEGEAALASGNAAAEAVYAISHYYEFLGEPNKTLRLLQEYLRQCPDDPHLRWRLAELSLRHGDVPQALLQYRTLIERQPEKRGTVLAKLEAAVNQVGGSGQKLILSELFSLNLETGQHTASRAWLERLLPLPPEEDELRLNLLEKLAIVGDQAMDMGELEITRVILQQILLLDPYIEAVRDQLNELEELLTQKRKGELEELLQSGRLSGPDHLSVLQELSHIYRSCHESEDRIISIYQQLVRIPFPGQAEAILQLGLSFQRKGMVDLAEKQFEQFVQMPMPTDTLTEGLYLIGVASEDAGRQEKAREAYGKILEVNLSYKDVLPRLKKLPAVASASAAALPASGWDQVRERYEDIVQIGVGGMGTVYRAMDRVLRRKVALKVMKDEMKQVADAVPRFIREAQAASHLRHPGIVAIYDINVGDPVFISMEHVEGESLRDTLKHGPLDPALVKKIALQLCDALGYAHTQGVVHRDIKPDNIMLTAEGQVKVADFGLAHLNAATSNLTQVGSVMGTPWYMAPEQILGKPVDSRTDLYALGISFYELLTGRVPFMEGDVSYQHLHEPPMAPGILNPKVPRPLETLIMKCLEKKPEDRYLTAEALGHELQRLP